MKSLLRGPWRAIRPLPAQISYSMLRALGGPLFANQNFAPSLLWKHWFIQKILRINSHVPWPVHWTSQIKSPEKIRSGTRLPGLAIGCYLDGRNGIEIGANTWIGPRVAIISMNHDLQDYTHYLPGKPIRIGDNCWIATGAILLPGVELGHHVVVAAGAVVTHSFEDNVVLAGTPAQVIRKLPPYGTPN